MPQVPYVSYPSEQPGPAPAVFQRLEPNAGAWGAVGRGLQGLGQDVSQLGQVLAANQLKIQNERDAADANQAYINASLDKASVDANYFAQEGSNAVDALPDYYKSLQEIRDKHIAQLGSDKAKKLFDNDFTRATVTDINAATRYAAGQHKAYVSGQSDARVQSEINNSAADFSSNEKFDEHIGVIGREVANKGRTEGWSEEKVTLETNKAQGQAYAARIREMAIYAPFQAEELFNENVGKLDPDAVPVIENAIRTSKLTTGVKQGINRIFSGGAVGRSALIEGMKTGKIAVPESIQPIIRGLRPQFGSKIAALTAAAEEATGQKAVFRYGRRSHEEQIRLWNESTGGGTHAKTFAVADPGKSRHEWGGAVDVEDGPVLDYMHAHAAEYGLGPASARRGWAYDPGHIQEAGPAGRVIGPAVGKILKGPGGGFVGRIMQAEGGGAGISSPKGAVGIMQILPSTGREAAAEMGIEFNLSALIHDNGYNTAIGTHILNRLLHKYGGSEVLAAAAYNAGEGRVDGWWKAHGAPQTAEEVAAFSATLPKETQGYIEKVMGSTGVGYDPVPGHIYYAQNQNTGTGSAGLPLSVRLAQGQAYSDQVAKGDAEFAERMASAIRTRYNIEDAARTEEQQAAFDMVTTEALSNKVTSEDGLSANAKKALATLPGEKKITIHNLLEANSKDDIPETPAMLRKYAEIRGKLAEAGSTEAKRKVEIWDASLSRGLQKQLIEEQNKPVTEKAAAASKVSIGHAFDVLSIPLTAAKLIQPQAVQNAMSEKELTSYNANRSVFYNALSAELNRFAEEKKMAPTDDEIRQIGNDLLHTNMAIVHDPGLWLGPTDTPTPVPLFLMNKSDLQTFLNITPESAEMVMESEIPNDTEEQIRASILRKTGKIPSMEVVWRVYQVGKYKQLRVLHEMQGGG